MERVWFKIYWFISVHKLEIEIANTLFFIATCTYSSLDCLHLVQIYFTVKFKLAKN